MPSEPECQIQRENPAASEARTGHGRGKLSCLRIPASPEDDQQVEECKHKYELTRE